MARNGIKRPRNRPLDIKAHGRSAVTNGNILLARIDGRSFWARRYKDLCRGLISDLGGDSAPIGEAQKLLVRRGALLALELERRESRFSEHGAEDAELEVYSRVVGGLRRLIETLNIHHGRIARDATLNVHDYLRKIAQEEAAHGTP
jgi:hypothetical protein